MKKVNEIVTYQYTSDKERIEHEKEMIKSGYEYKDSWLNSDTECTVVYEKEF